VWRDEGINIGRDEGINIGRDEGINIGEKRGEQRGLYSSIKMGLEVKFNNLSEKLLSSIEKITDIDKLKKIQKAIFMIDDRDEFEQFIKKI
jgi:hypothetical protein